MPEAIPPSKASPPGEEVGQVVGFFAVPSVAIIAISKDSLKLGDTVWIVGHTTDLKQTIESMEVDRKPITQAAAGQEVGIKVTARVRRHDKVYKVS